MIETDSIPSDAKLDKSNNLLTGSHGNAHTYDNGKLYRLEQTPIFGYFEAKNTTLSHAEHGKGKGALKTCNLPNGTYELRKGQEFINDELVQIVD